MTKRIYVSDLHLESVTSPAFTGFEWLLTSAARQEFEVYLLGDIVELWVGDDDDSELATALRTLLTKVARAVPTHIMHGNRDFLYGPRFAEDTGVVVLDDPTMLADGTLLAHGDAFCTDDEAYQNFRNMVRSESWQADILSKTLDERRAFGQALRAQSKATNANKASNIMDVNDVEVTSTMVSRGSSALVHGHTHRAGVHKVSKGKRYVLGDWGRCGWYLKQEHGDFTLRCFSLARRYESENRDPLL